jgi:biopolymer transport protein ExbB
MWILAALSVATVAVVINRTIVLLRTRDDVRALHDEVAELIQTRHWKLARERVKLSRSYEARVVAAGLDVAGDGPRAAEQRMAGATQFARLSMEKHLALLRTVGSNAPFIGVLGTVVGIGRCLSEREASCGFVNVGLMSGIAESLTATAVGILVALPAVAFFNYFQRLIKIRLARADALSRELLACLDAY